METVGEGTPSVSSEIGLEQRLEALENAVQRLTDAAWRKLLDAHLPAGEPVAVLADPAIGPFGEIGRRSACAPPDTGGSAAGVARLEVQRLQGIRFAFVPEGAVGDLEQDAHLTELLRTRFHAIASDPEVGTVFEASVPEPGDQAKLELGALLDSICRDDPLAPMLDWSSSGLAHLLPGRTLFRPVHPEPPALPYLAGTIGVVLVDDLERMDEAARVAAAAAVLVSADDAGGAIAVETRLVNSTGDPAPARVLIGVATDEDDEWLGQLAEAVGWRPGVEVRAAVDPIAAAAETDAPTILFAERGVLPLPQCIEAAERLLGADERLGGVAVKLFDADGSLEAAGGAAFADGSVVGVAKGAPAAAPWHEYVRPVAAAVGLVVLRSAAARECVDRDGAGAADLAGLSARLWSSGWELRYQPAAAAVRVFGPDAAAAGVWPLEPGGLPARPYRLDDAAWRNLLVNDEVGAAR